MYDSDKTKGFEEEHRNLVQPDRPSFAMVMVCLLVVVAGVVVYVDATSRQQAATPQQQQSTP